MSKEYINVIRRHKKRKKARNLILTLTLIIELGLIKCLSNVLNEESVIEDQIDNQDVNFSDELTRFISSKYTYAYNISDNEKCDVVLDCNKIDGKCYTDVYLTPDVESLNRIANDLYVKTSEINLFKNSVKMINNKDLVMTNDEIPDYNNLSFSQFYMVTKREFCVLLNKQFYYFYGVEIYNPVTNKYELSDILIFSHGSLSSYNYGNYHMIFLGEANMNNLLDSNYANDLSRNVVK